MRVLVVTADASLATAAARMHPDAKVLVSSPTQLPSRSVEPFDVAVVDAGSDARNREVSELLEAEGTAQRSLLIGGAGSGPDGPPSLSRPFTLDELVGALGLAAPPDPDADGGKGLLGRLLRGFRSGAGEASAPPVGSGVQRVRAWPRMDTDRDPGSDRRFGDAVTAGERLRELLEDLPPVASVPEEAVALAVDAGERLEGRYGVVWLHVDGGLRPYHAGDVTLPQVGSGHPVVSGLAEDVSAVLLEPPGPGVGLVGVDVPAVVAAGLRHAGRFLGVVAVGGRGLTIEDRDELLGIARDRAPRLALARTLERLRRSQ